MLAGISETLRQYLLGAIPGMTVEIGAATDLQATSPGSSLVLLLYGIDQVNDVRAVRPRSDARPGMPVALKLQYLITSLAPDALESQRTLSRVLETFDNHPVFTAGELDAAISATIDRLAVQLRSMPLEGLNDLWSALGAAMRLSLYYEVNAQPQP